MVFYTSRVYPLTFQISRRTQNCLSLDISDQVVDDTAGGRSEDTSSVIHRKPSAQDRRRNMNILAICRTLLLTTLLVAGLQPLHATSPVVRLQGKVGEWQLTRDGQPYFIKGVGGDGSMTLLAKLGGNSIRTWGHDRLSEQLDEAQKLGLTVTAGIWLGQVRQGFDWSDADSLLLQRNLIREVVAKHKDHPALLMWALGNEMEDEAGKNGAVWSEINNLASMVKSLDSNHPTMTVIAELGGDKVRNLHEFCPEIDIVGINSYAGAASVAERYKQLGGWKPYILTEFGPPGIWETEKDEIGAYRELTSSAKANYYHESYAKTVTGNSGSCLGAYAFLWGQKQEVTATWFSLLLKDDSRLATVDVLSEQWTGKTPANRCPIIDSLVIVNSEKSLASATVDPDSTIRLQLMATDPEGDALKVSWELFADAEHYGTGGDAEAAAALFSKAILRSDATSAEVKLPSDGGLYRVFATIRDGHGGAAIANIPVRVDAPERMTTGKPTTLPFVVYAESTDEATWVPSGWMGDAKAIRLDPASTQNPQSGETSLRCEFTASSGWGAVAWQHPAQDWGDQRGGFDLSGARRLIFYARGDSGGEEVSFAFGLIGPEKRYFDTARRSLDKVKLTQEWAQFEIPLADMKSTENLTRIKTGFVWTVASSGKPVVFYLDNIHWE